MYKRHTWTSSLCSCIPVEKRTSTHDVYRTFVSGLFFIASVRIFMYMLWLDLVKKLLLALRMHTYAKDLIPDLMNALKVIALRNWNTEGIRTIATFLASTVPKSKQ